jgi:hypothetical protein
MIWQCWHCALAKGGGSNLVFAMKNLGSTFGWACHHRGQPFEGFVYHYFSFVLVTRPRVCARFGVVREVDNLGFGFAFC